jgi:3-hydroxyisobutyrate dehydrogenase-like beta-hydroxyacid dehydrogenase
MTTVAVLGLGEAGSAIARDLVSAGVRVRGFDPAPGPMPQGVEDAGAPGEAVRGADAVLSLNSAVVAVEVAQSAAAGLAADQLFADLNTAAPAVKRSVAAAAAPAAFTDVALIGAVPGKGVHTPALASGAGAVRFAEVFGGLGMPVTVVGAEPGAAAARKLARSVFAKGLAAAIGEALAAAERLGCGEWMYSELDLTLTAADGALLRRLVDGSLLHAARRHEEMVAAVAMLEELDVEPRVAKAARDWLGSLAEARRSNEMAR